VEIDVSGVKRTTGLYAGMALLALVGLMLLGRAFTPDGGQLLTWQEWQVRKLRQALLAERLQLLQDAGRLADLLAAGHPDPARVQVEVQAIRRHLAQPKVEGLAGARAALEAACQALLSWASGIGDYNAAVETVQQAREALDDGR
jgi:hypothetical protein